jgi:hypothetical protein
MELQMLNLKVLVCGLAVGSMGLTAMAQSEKPAGKPPAAGQPAGDRPAQNRPEPLSAEKAKAAWDLEANGVAKRLALKDDQAKSLVTAYDAARTSHQAASEKLRKDQQEKTKGIDRSDRDAMQEAMQANRKAMEDLNKSETDKFTKAVTTAIPGEPGTKAAKALSVFGFAPQWDRLVDTVGGFKLDAAKQQDALNALETFASEQSKNMANMGPGTDREAAAEDMKATREKLTTSLKKVLSEDQLKKVEENMGGGRGGRGGRGPNGGGGKGGGG